MNKYQKRVTVFPFPVIPNAYIILSFSRKSDERFAGEVWIKTNLSFLFHNPDTHIAAEWEPEYGPIQVWRESDAEHGKEHYFFNYVEDTVLNWSQSAVDREGLKPHLLAGNYNYIFDVLAEWTRR